MDFINFISTGEPVTVKAVGQTFTVSDGNPYRVALSKIDRHSIDVTVRPAESNPCPLHPEVATRRQLPKAVTLGPAAASADTLPAPASSGAWRRISDSDRGQIADELHLKAVARYATGGQRRGDFYAEDPLDEAEDEFIDGAFYIALARRERDDECARRWAAEAKVRELETKIRELVKQLVDANA